MQNQSKLLFYSRDKKMQMIEKSKNNNSSKQDLHLVDSLMAFYLTMFSLRVFRDFCHM